MSYISCWKFGGLWSRSVSKSQLSALIHFKILLEQIYTFLRGCASCGESRTMGPGLAELNSIFKDFYANLGSWKEFIEWDQHYLNTNCVRLGSSSLKNFQPSCSRFSNY